MLRTTYRLTALALVVASPFLASCTSNDSGASTDDPRAVTINASDDGCEVSKADVPAGTLQFEVTNTGSKVNEFYLLGEDGLRIVGEVENVGPDATRKLTVNAEEGTYYTACKPGMTGDGIRADFTVTASDDAPAVSATDQQKVDDAETNYAAYVKDQSAQLLTDTTKFLDLYTSGDSDDEARALYPQARTHWERIETVAESFGTLDPKMDLREADVEPGARWTGWHLIEKDLWPADAGKYRSLTAKQRDFYAADLLKNTKKLDTLVQDLDYPVDAIANGSRGLLEEVATGKATGEEEFWSHTDLYDFQANVDGARVAFEGVKPIVEENDPELATELTERFADLQTLLDEQKTGGTKTEPEFKLYTELSQDDVNGLSNAVDALAEPLGKLTAAVVS